MLAILAAALALLGTPSFERGTVAIQTASGTRTVSVQIAETARQRQHGLMHRRFLAANAGMVFLYPNDVRGGFWMKNTRIPLSIAFYGGDGRILRVMDMVPCRRDPCRVYDPGVAYRGALEVNRGEFTRWGVKRGDRITLRRR